MNGNERDEFWKELMGENGSGTGEKKPDDGEKDSELDSFIDYLDKNSNISDSSDDDDFWAQFLKADSAETERKNDTYDAWHQIPQQRPASASGRNVPKSSGSDSVSRGRTDSGSAASSSSGSGSYGRASAQQGQSSAQQKGRGQAQTGTGTAYRSTQSGQSSQAQRSAGTGQNSQTQRSAGAGQSPKTQRSAGTGQYTSSQTQRSTGTGYSSQAQRSAGAGQSSQTQRSTGTEQGSQAQRSSQSQYGNGTAGGSASQGQRNYDADRTQRITPTQSANYSKRQASQPNANYGAPVQQQMLTEEEIMGDKNFEVDFDFDGEYQDVNEKIVKRGRSKRTGCLGGILYFVFILCISVVLACLCWMAAVDVLGLGDEDEEVSVTISKSLISTEIREEEDEDGNITTEEVSVTDIDAVAELLYDEGLISYKWIFKIFCKFSSADEKIQAGTYVLNMNYDYRALVYGMNPSSGTREEIDVTIPEGYNTYQIVELLEENGVCTADELWEAITEYDFDYDFIDDELTGEKSRLEGYLFPDTYTFYVGDTASRVINKFLSNFNKKWTEEYDELASELGYTQAEIIIIASMIEKEAGSDDERATIASVIYNRLENTSATNGLLQIDSTIYYAIEETGESFSTSVDSEYNTYLHAGLTPTAIANPGTASIEAALQPESTSYYYYALGTDGVHHFFNTLDEHTAFVNSDEYGG